MMVDVLSTDNRWDIPAAVIILIVSAVAASFPTLAKRAPRIQPPEIIFFITKHFGTGVILATAFVHLLQEAFESLNHPSVSGVWKELTGFIVQVNHISTAIVERLSGRHPHGHHHHPSSSYHHNHDHDHDHDHDHGEHEENGGSDVSGSRYRDEPEETSADTNSITVRPASSINGQISRASLKDTRSGSHISLGHHRYESHHAHHHKVATRLVERQHIPVLYVPEPANGGEDPVCINVEILQDHDHEPVDQQDISRKTRIISILVLQLGIMVHSVVIGLTLSITEGAGFTTLLTAVVFHQLFEGLSLGIRISTLPDGPGKYRLLPVILCGLFAITAPLGLLLGAVVFPSPPGLSVIPQFPMYSQPYSQVKNNALLIRGLMCSLSAGMLMYASAVEMLAGDFVMSSEMRQLSLGKQTIALGSLILGTCAMAVIGVWL